MVKSKLITPPGDKKPGAEGNNKEHAPAHEGRAVFSFNSPGRNRAKYLCLFTIRWLDEQNIPVTFNALYLHSGIPYRTLINALPKWARWRYLYKYLRATPVYAQSSKGQRFLWLLDKYLPGTTARWRAEREEWERFRPLISVEQPRPVMVAALEPFKAHRPGHPGINKRIPVIPAVIPAPAAAPAPVRYVCKICHTPLVADYCMVNYDYTSAWHCTVCDMWWERKS